MKTLDLENIETISVYLIDKDGNGYVGVIDSAYAALIVQMTTFYQAEGIESVPLESVIKKQDH